MAVISPFNSPAMVAMWFFPIAIAAGNTVILKPSEKDPSAAIWIARLWREAGLPDGVFTVLNGDKAAVDGLLTSPDVSAVSFVGSTPIARYVYETGTRHGKRVQALGGAKNHMLVLPDADLNLVADSAINAGYGSAGERCMAVSVVLAVEPIADELIEKVSDRISRLRIGDGRRNPDMGPLVTREHRDRVASYIEVAEEDGATVVVDGRGVEVDGEAGGFWLGPTLIDGVPTTSRVYTEEIFGPVLSVVRVASYEEGLKLINGGQFGNGTAIFTNDGGVHPRHRIEGARVQDRGDPVQQQGLAHPVLVVGMGLDQARDDVLACAVDSGRRGGGRVIGRSMAEFRDPAVLDDHRDIVVGGRTRSVDDTGMDEHDSLVECRFVRQDDPHIVVV